jgi:O-succinylbenzoate synthase
VVLVEWRRADGAVGWGECPTLSTAGYSDETTDVAWTALSDGLAAAALAAAALGVDLHEGAPASTTSPMAAGALADAALDARLRSEGRSLVDELGGVPRALPMCRVAGVGTIDESAVHLAPGEVLRKFKVTPATIERLVEVRRRHPDLPMAADANGSFASADDLPPWLDDVCLVYLEQPCPAGDLAAHARIRGRFATPIALDESLGGVPALERAVDAGALDVVSVKPARMGGVLAGLEALRLAARAGLDAFVGGMLETGVGRATAAALAAHPAATLATDLGPSSRYFERDVTEPVVATADGLVVPDRVGCGREPEPDLLRAATVDRVEIR